MELYLLAPSVPERPNRGVVVVQGGEGHAQYDEQQVSYLKQRHKEVGQHEKQKVRNLKHYNKQAALFSR